MNALELARRALAAAGEDAEAVVHSERSGLARFAASEVHQPTLIENELVQVRVLLPDGRTGFATSNRIDDAGLAAVARRAREAAAAAPPDPESPGLAEPQAPPPVDGFDEPTAALGPGELARSATAAIDAASLPVYGFFTSGTLELAVASSTGVGVEQQLTDATLTVLAATPEVSGWATRTSRRAGDLDLEACAREAVEKAERTRGAGTLEPGSYRAVLEPYALGELLQYFADAGFNGLAFAEERSFLSGRLGERLFDPRVSIADDAPDPHGLPKAFDFEGVPKRRVPLVEEGVARGVVWDRASASRAGTATTGHAGPAQLRPWGPIPQALVLAPGEAESVEELAELVGDGVYVTRVHYVNTVSEREGILTGMTRDGTFRIRGGRIAEPLVNHRFTLSMPELLADVPGLTREAMLVNQSDFYDERYPFGALVPALATGCFTITGAGSSPGL
ncbi:MAG TPA: metallopeptidase TldD-related protein [Gaiellaceae bacterium]|nr:metallopeptidase TldD-related protein [Gaiellaceae bacterium]